MNILIVGNGQGSWAIRGEQLGAALGARVVHVPSDDSLRWADVVVLIKRAALNWAELVHRFEKPIIWDALDVWSQPADNALSDREALDRFWRLCAAVRPALVIGATSAMATAAACRWPAVFLPHHARPGLTPAPIRPQVQVVAYEGNPAYLGRWQVALQRECQRRNWDLLINPPDLREADLLVALRDGQWDGWMCRTWKSGVKAVNAVAAGRPLITQDAVGIRDVSPCHSLVETPDGLSDALDAWTDAAARRQALDLHTAIAPQYQLDVIAASYRVLIEAAVGAGHTGVDAQREAYVDSHQ